MIEGIGTKCAKTIRIRDFGGQVDVRVKREAILCHFSSANIDRARAGHLRLKQTPSLVVGMQIADMDY
jgi:hypothetical protein